MPVTQSRVRGYLDEQGVAYELLSHRRDFTASEAAQDTHTPGREFAKCVLVVLDGTYALAVLPAHHVIDVELMRHSLGLKELRMASEREMVKVFPDCDVGAEPPFGNLYRVPVYVSAAMADDRWLTFNAGSHDEAMRVPWADFVRLVNPHVLDFSKPRTR